MIVSDCAIPGNAARGLAGQEMSLLWSMGGWEVWLLIIDNKFLLTIDKQLINRSSFVGEDEIRKDNLV